MRRVDIPKPQGGVRTLGIPTLTDRLIQQALHQVLSPIFEVEFSESSYGFRPGRSAHQAVKAARQHVAEGRRVVIDMDLEKFFDRVNHDLLMQKLSTKVGDGRVLRLIRRYLEAGMMAEGIVSPRTEGTPQGGPLSPLLSNILLTELDREMERRGHAFCRYADDCTIYVGSQAAGERVLAGISQILCERLNETNRALEDLDGWLRRKLRCILWSQRTRPYTRARNLMKAGLREARAFCSAFNQRGPWWNSGASQMDAAFPKVFFDPENLTAKARRRKDRKGNNRLIVLDHSPCGSR